MPQGPIASTIAKSPSNVLVPLLVDANGNLLVSIGGTDEKSKLNITAATVVKAIPGKVIRVSIIAPGTTSGAFTLNDCATTGAASAANEIWTLPYNGAANVAGAVFDIDFPCTVGIVVSAVPGAGSPVLAVSYI